jgi:membrane AbrB-like protein
MLNARRAGAACAVIVAALTLGELLEIVHIPVAHLFAGMGVGLAVAMRSTADLELPRWSYALAQGLMGAAIGTVARAGVGGSAGVLAALPVLVVATILMSLAAGSILARRAQVGHTTALLGMVAGGSAAVVAAADDLDADARMVAVMQYMRVALVTVTVPLIAVLLQAHGRHVRATDLPGSADEVTILVVIFLLAVAGHQLARRVHLPAPALAGPLLLGSVLGWMGALPDAPVPTTVVAVSLTVIGVEIGLRFDRAAMRALRSMLGVISALTIGLIVACAGLAALLSLLAGVRPLDAYLMTTPGGINAVLAASVALNGVNMPLVALAQTLRLLAMVLVMPLLANWMSTRLRAHAQAPVRPDPRSAV